MYRNSKDRSKSVLLKSRVLVFWLVFALFSHSEVGLGHAYVFGGCRAFCFLPPSKLPRNQEGKVVYHAGHLNPPFKENQITIHFYIMQKQYSFLRCCTRRKTRASGLRLRAFSVCALVNLKTSIFSITWL